VKARRLAPLLVVVAGLLAYHNSFTGGFVFDDVATITENPSIRRLWPIWHCLAPLHRGGLTTEGRPLINLSLAVNYALGGYNVWGYHAFNLTVHILAGLTLLGVVRRTLLQPALRDRFGAVANELALATAVLWTVHPLQTEAVTYIVQRVESVMGLFYLLTLYCFIRGAESPPVGSGQWFMGSGSRGRLWYGLSVAACALGMASKEVMVSAPVMVMLYDRTFVSSSFGEAWRRRQPYYLGLAATWILLALVEVSAGHFATTAMNARRIGLTWWQYLATEPGVILYYLRLCAWPSPLCLNHPWPIARSWMRILPAAIAVGILLVASAWALAKKPAPTPTSGPVWGFIGAWFFLILAPSSTVVPLHNPFYEHRMYLSLAAVASAIVMGLYSLAGRRSLAVFLVAALGLGIVTCRRNQDYRDAITITADAVAKFPHDPLPHFNLAVSFARAGRTQEAIAQYEQVLQMTPNDWEAHYNLGLALAQAGRVQEAIGQYEQALQLRPDSAGANYNLGLALARMDRSAEAIRYFEETTRLEPDDADAHNDLAVALAQQGRLQEAIGHWEQALRIDPGDADLQYNLASALHVLGKLPEAIRHYERAVDLNPNHVGAQNGLAWLLATIPPADGGDPGRAVTLAQRACRLTDNRVPAYLDTLAAAYAATGRFNDAVAAAEKAVELATADGQLQAAKIIEGRLQLYREGRAYRREGTNSVTKRSVGR